VHADWSEALENLRLDISKAGILASTFLIKIQGNRLLRKFQPKEEWSFDRFYRRKNLGMDGNPFQNFKMRPTIPNVASVPLFPYLDVI
jgi:hypothetical protein